MDSNNIEITSTPQPDAVETKAGMSEKCRELINDIQNILEMYFPERNDLSEINTMARDLFKVFVEECIVMTIANIDDEEQKKAFQKNPSSNVLEVIRYAVATTDFESSSKQELISRIDSLTPEDIEAVTPYITKLDLMEVTGPMEDFIMAAGNKLKQDKDLSLADAMVKMGLE